MSSLRSPAEPVKPPERHGPCTRIAAATVDLYLPIIGPAAWTLYSCLARHMDPDGIARHSDRELALACGISRSSVIRLRKILLRHRLIEVVATRPQALRVLGGIASGPDTTPRTRPRLTRRPVSTELRRAVYERDGYRCQECGDWHDLTLDHIHPVSKGGRSTYENLRTLCRSCNSSKGAAT